MTVEVIVNGHDMDVTPRLREHIQKKVGKLDRYIEPISEVRVEVSQVKSARSASDRQVAQLTLRGKGGMLLRAEERTDDIYASIDAVVDKISRQIDRYKGKHWRRRGNGASADTLAQPEAPVEAAEGESPIIRRKRFTLTPMDESEAIDQMALLGHDQFFVFFNANTNAINVLYQRRDGTYGLIEPELG